MVRVDAMSGLLFHHFRALKLVPASSCRQELSVQVQHSDFGPSCDRDMSLAEDPATATDLLSVGCMEGLGLCWAQRYSTTPHHPPAPLGALQPAPGSILLGKCAPQNTFLPFWELLGPYMLDSAAYADSLGDISFKCCLFFFFELRHKVEKLCFSCPCCSLHSLFLLIQDITFQACRHGMILKCQIHVKTQNQINAFQSSL